MHASGETGQTATRHYKRPQERPFTRAERDYVTILFGGLTTRHDRLVKAAMESLGYRLHTIPTPEKADFQTGKEYGNNGQCNPTYFTCGALVNYLKRLRDEEGMATADILDNYIFATAGACGPCRFGMYEAEYRLALRNSGFDGFRVLLFQQKGGLKQSEGEAGLELNIDFALALLNAIAIGDLLTELANQLRPYEVSPGQVDRVFEKVTRRVDERLRARGPETQDRLSALLAKLFAFLGPQEMTAKVLSQLRSKYYISTLEECRRIIDREIEVDFTRGKPICKITGEFWAQTTEGDGNYKMFRFLESQGAEVLIEPVITWINYMIIQERSKLEDQKDLDKPKTWTAKLASEFRFRLKRFRLTLATKMLNREYDRIRAALGGTTHAQICQLELQRMGHPYYNRKSGGGEGHLEVAKSIYYSTKSIAHMVMSLKPFGCMPSAQSDGAQAAVQSHYPDMIFIPIETSGEGDINAHSRAQMALGEAKAKSKREFQTALAQSGYTLAEIRRYCETHTSLRKPLQHFPQTPGVAGRAASFVRHVAALMDADPAVAKKSQQESEACTV